MDFEKITDLKLQKVQQCREFVLLYLKKREASKEIEILRKINEETKDLLIQCKSILKEYSSKDNDILIRYKKLMDSAKKQQLIMLYIMEELDKKSSNQASNILSVPLVTPLKSNGYNLQTPKSVKNWSAYSNQPSGMTPRMYLSEYINSPFATRIKPISLQFVDFEAIIDSDEFNAIPKYMRGRESKDELQMFLDTVIIKCLTEKYILFCKPRNAVKNFKDQTLWKVYHDQELYFPGRKFITQGDVSQLTGKVIDKKLSVRIQMLRHLKILQEARKGATIYYIWIYKYNNEN